MARGSAASRHGAADVGRLEPVVAVDPDYLLGYVLHTFDVGAEGGRCKLREVVTDFEFELAEDLRHIFLCKVHSDEAIDPVGVKRKGDGSFLCRVEVDYPVHYLARSEKLDEFAGTLECGKSIFGVETLFKA